MLSLQQTELCSSPTKTGPLRSLTTPPPPPQKERPAKRSANIRWIPPIPVEKKLRIMNPTTQGREFHWDDTMDDEIVLETTEEIEESPSVRKWRETEDPTSSRSPEPALLGENSTIGEKINNALHACNLHTEVTTDEDSGVRTLWIYDHRHTPLHFVDYDTGY